MQQMQRQAKSHPAPTTSGSPQFGDQVNATLQNSLTGQNQRLNRIAFWLKHGSWGIQPPNQVDAGSSATFSAVENFGLQGIQGGALYESESDGTIVMLAFHVQDWIGDTSTVSISCTGPNSYDCSVTPVNPDSTVIYPVYTIAPAS